MASEWREMPFSQAVTVNPRVQLTRGATYPFVDMGAVSSGSRSAYASEQRQFDGGGSRFTAGDTLMARITPCLENGKIARFAGQPGEIAHGSTEFIVIRGREGVSETDYAYYLTKWEGVSGFAISQMTGTSGRQRVPSEALDHLYVPLPPLPEQRAIAHILGALDDKIELNRQTNETLEALAQAIFKSWFVDFDPVRAKAEGRQPAGMDAGTAALFPAAFEDSELGKIPKGWKVAQIGELATAVGGSTPNTDEPSFWNGDIPFATPKDMSSLTAPILMETERRITKQGLECISSGLLPEGTVLMSSRAPIGYLAITDIPVAVNQGFIAMKCDGPLPNHYVLQWAKHNLDEIIAHANGTTFLEISKRNFRPIKALLPDPRVLKCYTQWVEPLFKQIAINLKQSRTLAAIRDALLPKLLSGEIRVKDAERFVEARL